MADPVASFLEREQELFGEKPEDNPTPPNVPEVLEPPAASIEPNGVNGLDVTGIDFTSNNAAPLTNGTNGRTISPAVSDKSENEPVFQSKPDFEPESVQKWREGFEKNLQKLDEEEQKLIDDLKAQAKKELEDFQSKRIADLEQRTKVNRENQAEFLKNVEKASAGILWQRIAKVVESDEKTPKNVVDTDRMRDLLIQCKDGGPKPTSE